LKDATILATVSLLLLSAKLLGKKQI